MQFVRVLVPLRLDWIPVYRSDSPLRRGQTVGVMFSGRRYAGVVWETGADPGLDSSRILPVLPDTEDVPDVTPAELEFWEFLSSYYLCSPNEVYRTARPMQMLRAARQERTRTRKQQERAAAARKAAEDRIARLEQRLGAVEARLAAPHRSESVVARLNGQREELICRLNELRRSLPLPADTPPAPPMQTEFHGKPLVVSGAGRRRHYLEAAEKALQGGGQVLILTPEAAFCRRLEEFLRPALGERLRTVDSAALRGRTSDSLLRGESLAVLGPKAAVFLPFSRLSLVIVDEEQDSLYKQTDAAPRYNGRDAALKLAGIHGAAVILGSSFPSLETRYNCLSGKFEAIAARGGAEGRLAIVDISAEKRKNGMSGYFSRKLAAAIRAARGPVVLVRGWEKPDELSAQTAALFPELRLRTMTLGELKHEGCPGAAMIAVLQADALVADDGFRSDERALQLVALLRSLAPETIVQTSVPERFDGSRTAESLLQERRRFNFPPYTRLVDIRREATGEIVERHFLKRGPGLLSEKRRLLETLPPGTCPDVDPA